MGKQFSDVNCSLGAPMGRAAYGDPNGHELFRLFKVQLDSGGYDDGGAYWGLPNNIYCAQGEDFQRFVRADSREEAADELNIRYQLKKPL